MNRRLIFALAAGFVLVGVIAAGAYQLGRDAGPRHATHPSAAASQAAPPKPAAGRRVLYWHDPMVPGQRFDKPGKSPFMDMPLVPVYADEAQEQAGVAVASGVRQNLGIRVVEVRQGPMAAPLQVVGSVAFDERDVALVQARSNGYVEKLFARAPFDPVRKGQPLLQLYVPDWIAAQEEYQAVARMPASAATAGLLDAARERMRLAGMDDAQIRQLAARGTVNPRITVSAPIDGVVTELSAREGMTVAAGAPLFRINGLGTVWVNAEVPESAAAQVQRGTAVEASSPAFPGQKFAGKVEALLPQVNAATRTLTARIALSNPGARLLPGMFATIRMMPAAGKDVLLVPSEALIQTGTRTVVIAALGEGRFAPLEVVTGQEANGETAVLKGLAAGQRVVASGQFLIDSEASLRGALRRLDQLPAEAPATPTHHASGKVERIGADEVIISHGPVASLQWGPMTMGFGLPAGGLPAGLRPGDTVTFEFQAQQGGSYKVVTMSRADAGKTGPANPAPGSGK
jgi:Cu(I)/Ag(I) efflux system membrane fusion protein